jgi:hypothetical protein
MTTEEMCSTDDKEDKAAESEEEVNEESPIPSSGKAVSGCEADQRYIRLDDASLA